MSSLGALANRLSMDKKGKYFYGSTRVERRFFIEDFVVVDKVEAKVWHYTKFGDTTGDNDDENCHDDEVQICISLTLFAMIRFEGRQGHCRC